MAGFSPKNTIADIEINSVDKLFDNLKNLADNREKARQTQANFTAEIDKLNKDFATNPENNLYFGPDGIPTTPPPAIVAGKKAGLQAKADFETMMERNKASATILGKMDAADKFNKSLTDSNGGPALPNPDDPRLLRMTANGDLVSLGQAKTEALNEAATKFPAVKSYQTASPAVEGYLTQEKKGFRTGSIRQSKLVDALSNLEKSKADPTSWGSISDKWNVFMQKALSSEGGGLSKPQEDDLRELLDSQYDELGASYNNAIDAAPKFSKVPLGPKGISDIIQRHVPINQRGKGGKHTPEQIAAYNQLRAAGKSKEEAKAGAGL